MAKKKYEKPVLDSEEWRPVPDQPSYEVSSFGRVRRLWPKESRYRLLTPSTRKKDSDYRCVKLAENGETRNWFVHRLVMLAFRGPCPDGQQTCHNNGVASDNRLSNLRYDTPRGNAADREKHGTIMRGEANGLSKLTNRDVVTIRQERAAGATLEELASKFGVSTALIGAVYSRTVWAHIHDQTPYVDHSRRRGRLQGEAHARVKLSERQVLEIRRLRAEGGHTYKVLAARFRVSPSLIRAITTRQVWTHVP